jgi:hypothetical protein
MSSRISTGLITALAVASAVMVGAGQAGTSQGLPLEPLKERGRGVTGAFEGWYKNPDGTFTMLVGYFNRNSQESLDVPVGPNNRVEPGAPDQGQPTHFMPRRQWGVFTVVVPADFGTKKLTWTLTSNGETTAIPLTLHQAYEVAPFKDPATGNQPPVLQFEQSGPSFQGPPRVVAATMSARAGEATPFTFWASDDAVGRQGGGGRGQASAPVTVSLSKFRGPGTVTFANARPPVQGGQASTTATFSAPGEYIVRVQANDQTGDGGGGFQCCWTNAHVKVLVRAGE